MEFRILGPLEILVDGRPLAPPAAKPRALLADLLVHANELVTADRLIDDLWEGRPPASAAKVLQGYVSRLRDVLPGPRGELIATRPGGYVLCVRPEQLDLARFERLVSEGREAVDPEARADRLRAALVLWRGPPLVEFQYATFAQAAIARLEELRLAALEARIEVDLELGRDAELVGELESLARGQPHRERLAEQLMLALYRSGRQAEALEVYRRTRSRLADDLGLEPGPALRRLERAILAHDVGLQLPAAPRPRPTLGAARRLVTVVVAHVAPPPGRLDPEAVHGRLARAWEVFTDLLERHGARVERVLGDAVVGCFGLTEAREDDPVRAVRAAVALKEAERDLAVRIAVDTGEVFVGAGGGREMFAAGGVLDGVARLALEAERGEIRLGAGAYRLVEATVRAEPVIPGAWRLLELRADGRPTLRSSSTPLIDRERELGELHAALASARSERRCRLLTVIGPAGIGKSRLAAEFADHVEAAVVVGRCRPRGEGTTYGALADMLAQLGESEDPLVRRPDETFPAVRRLFERVAADRALVAVVEDAHWAEPMLLDLLTYLQAFSRDSPILLLCLARPELLEIRPAWDTDRIVLEPLSEADARKLVASAALDPSRAARIIKTAEGNPFFLEQLIAVQDEGDELPATIQTVLAARIDGLDPDERVVLEHACVVGHGFEVPAVAELVPDAQRAGLAPCLMSLMRRGLIRPDRRRADDGEDAFRFAHALIREAVYAGMPKRQRAELHERAARRLERIDRDDELIGHHLERAYRHRADLATIDEHGRALAAEAARRLASAARTGLSRGDARGAARLLERAVALDHRPPLMLDLGMALLEAGSLADADRVLTEAVEHGDPHLKARASVEREFARLHANATGIDRARRAADRALRVLTRGDDRLGQCRAWRLLAWIRWTEGRAAAADAAWERAAQHARAAGDQRELFEILGWRASAAAFGPMPAADAIARCTAIRDEVRGSHVAMAVTQRPLALLYAITGDLDRARRLVREANAILDELGRMQSVVSHHEAQLELLAGEAASAEERLRVGYERLEQMGERALLATTAAMLAQAVFAQGRSEEADALCAESARHCAPEDLVTQAIWRGVRARILAGRGRADEAEALAREGVALVAATDALIEHGDALLALADVLEVRGRTHEARAAAGQALALYERKGAVVLRDRRQRVKGADVAKVGVR